MSGLSGRLTRCECHTGRGKTLFATQRSICCSRPSSKRTSVIEEEMRLSSLIPIAMTPPWVLAKAAMSVAKLRSAFGYFGL